MSTLSVGTIKSATSAPPVFQNSSGTEKGQLAKMWINFDGANTLHGNKDNLTGKSRLSIDFRIFPLKYYNEEEQADAKTITQKKRLVIGEYWTKL